MKQFFWGLAVIVGSNIAIADSRACLDDVSNRDLLREVASRMHDKGSSEGSLQADFICSGYNLSIKITNAETGSVSSYSQTFTYQSTCSEYANLFTSKIGSDLSSAKILGMCDGYTMSRVSLNSSGEAKLLDRTTFTYQSECTAAVNKINARL